MRLISAIFFYAKLTAEDEYKESKKPVHYVHKNNVHPEYSGETDSEVDPNEAFYIYGK